MKRPDRSSEHPATLPWYAAGSLDADRRSEVERHLEICGDCREELELWRTVAVVVRDDDTHPSVDEIGTLVDGGELPSDRRREIEDHLATCASCREDLEVARALTTKRPAARRAVPGWLRALSATAAALLLIAIGVVAERVRPSAVQLEPVARVVLEPVYRTEETQGRRPVLDAASTTFVAVLLPDDRPDGKFHVQISTAAGAPVHEAPGPVAADEQGVLTLLLRGIEEPGEYRLVVRPAGAGGSWSADYVFHVRGASRK